MTENERRFTPSQKCSYCGVETPMEIIGSHTRLKREANELHSSQSSRSATVYELISCPACEEVTLRSDSGSVSKYERQQGVQAQSPEPTKRRQSLDPDPFKTAYAATYTFRKFDPVAYAAMLGHLAKIRECNRHKRL